MEITLYIIFGIAVAIIFVLCLIGGMIYLLKLIFDFIDWTHRKKRSRPVNLPDLPLSDEMFQRRIQEAINASD